LVVITKVTITVLPITIGALFCSPYAFLPSASGL
jgi:hypothetical protein